jgi:adenine-specific DNA-methyltransferase
LALEVVSTVRCGLLRPPPNIILLVHTSSLVFHIAIRVGLVLNANLRNLEVIVSPRRERGVGGSLKLDVLDDELHGVFVSGLSDRHFARLLQTRFWNLETISAYYLMTVNRLNYIGSKHQLIDWILTTIYEKTEMESLKGQTVADLFAGTGIVSYNMRCLGAKVIANDAEQYSYTITHAMSRSVYNDRLYTIIKCVQKKLKTAKSIGFITRHYSPFQGNERMFFTVENANKIDYTREVIERLREHLDDDEYKFLLASLVTSADAISNVPAVYGCFLKNFKQKALKPFVLKPVHENTNPSDGQVFNMDVLQLPEIHADIVYLDPPYNERQYSKNYFPLNVIIKEPDLPLKGKTGIPSDCFISSFCKKSEVHQAFRKTLDKVKAKWVFISYNSESLIPKEEFIKLLENYGEVSVVEREYKRFKSYEYNEDKKILEFIFCIRIR